MNKVQIPGATTALILLFFASFFNYLDRFALSVLLPSIKEDLVLSDTQLGGLNTAFTISYVILGIPFARWADKYSRKNIIAFSVALWSAMTAICGLAQNFVQLSAARVMVGVGEAGGTPPAHSIISDYFPIEKRAKALAIYGIGAPVGLMFGFVFASWLTETYSWRIAFFALGAPGVVLALLIYFFVREPVRGQSDPVENPAEIQETPTFWISVKTVLSSPTYRHISVGTGLYVIVYIGVVSWLPSYFIRSFGMGLTEVGFWLAMSIGLSQLIGMVGCGVLTDIMVKRDVRWYAWIPALAMLISTPLFVIVFGTESAILSAVALFPAFLIGIFQGPATFAAVQGITHVRMRATAVAIFLLITNLIGGGFGPLFTGWLSDQFIAAYGQDSLRWSLMIVSVFFGLWASLHYYLASRHIQNEMSMAPGS